MNEQLLELTVPFQKRITIRVVAKSKDVLPTYQSLGAAGADVRAHISEEIILAPSKSALIPTGCVFEIPAGFEIQIRPRSGLALKSQVTVLNTPGTIDSDFRGEVAVILINHGSSDFVITPGMRIAQIVVNQVVQAEFVSCASLTSTERGSQGFGHTGI